MKSAIAKFALLLVLAGGSAFGALEPGVQCVHRQVPDYPTMLKVLKIGGKVKLKLTVGTDGKVKKTVVTGGNPVLAELASVAAKNWVYRGVSQTSELTVEVVFDPSGKEPQIVE